MTDQATHDGLSPGLHVVRDETPLVLAGQVSARLRADLCSTLAEADAALAARRDRPILEADALDALRDLAGRIVVAERIARRTTDRAAAEVAERMADVGMGVAVHPATIRERAAAVVQALAALAQADQLLETHDASAAAEAAAAPVPAPAPAVVGAPAASKAPRRRGFFRRKRSHAEDTAESSDLLRSIAATSEDVFGARRASAARQGQRALLVVRRDSALEDVRVAEHAWYDLAGETTDPADVEDLVHRLDPQHQDALVAAQEVVSVRAASAVFDELMAQWQSSWEELDLDAPLPVEAEAAVAHLAERAAGAVVLVGAAAERGIDLTTAAPGAVVVVVEGPLLSDA